MKAERCAALYSLVWSVLQAGALAVCAHFMQNDGAADMLAASSQDQHTISDRQGNSYTCGIIKVMRKNDT